MPAEERRAPKGFSGSDEDWDDFRQARDSIRKRMAGARRLFLLGISDDVAKRTAWEVLCGPVDWEAAETLGEQPVEIENFNCHRPDVHVLGEHGLLAELTGGLDAMAEVREELGQPPLPDYFTGGGESGEQAGSGA
jgi:hypothetical protein